MHVHEYQAKLLFSQFDIPVPEYRLATTAAEAVQAAQALGGKQWMVKAQVHSGARSKAGGVKLVEKLEDVEKTASSLLGQRLITVQTGPQGLPIHSVLVELPVAIAREIYVSLLVDRNRERVAILASGIGGVDIERLAAEQPEQIYTEAIDNIVGLQAYQCRKLSFKLELEGQQMKIFGRILDGLYRLVMDRDIDLVEINPLVITHDDQLIALDAKVNVDDNALFRHPALAQMRDTSQEEEKERAAREHGLNYVTLDGDIGCMVNGAGLAMATMDLIKLQGGEPANFLDVGGTATAARVAEAFKLILSDAKVNGILVNIFGGIVHCDLIAEGIIQAVREVGVKLPVVVRLEGTNVDLGRKLLADSGLNIISATELTEAATEVVAAARQWRDRSTN
ncbi:MAG: ADP-forming succinate--CoA ligase subunit beta [Gammaproteobacteria bacterium]